MEKKYSTSTYSRFTFLFTEASDFTNAIEPSAIGGQKIAQAIVRLIQNNDFTKFSSFTNREK